jgi:hypothetical protein
MPGTLPRPAIAVIFALLVLLAAILTNKHPDLSTLNLNAKHDAVLRLAAMTGFGFHVLKTKEHAVCWRIWVG